MNPIAAKIHRQHIDKNYLNSYVPILLCGSKKSFTYLSKKLLQVGYVHNFFCILPLQICFLSCKLMAV